MSALIAAAAVSAGGACWAAAFAGPVWVVGKLNDRAALRRDIPEMLAGAESYANGEHRRQAGQAPAAVRRHYAEQLREQARAAYRRLDYPGALDLIARAAELDPGRPAVWENARTVILTAVTGGRPVAEPERPQARVLKTGRYSQTVECGCGSRFEAPKGTAAAECLGCETTARLRAAGIGAW